MPLILILPLPIVQIAPTALSGPPVVGLLGACVVPRLAWVRRAAAMTNRCLHAGVGACR